MSMRLVSVIAVAAAMLSCTLRVLAQGKGETTAEKTTSISEKTKSMEKMAGYFNIYWDAKAGKLWMEIDKWGTEVLYQSSIPAGGWLEELRAWQGAAWRGARVRVLRGGAKELI